MCIVQVKSGKVRKMSKIIGDGSQQEAIVANRWVVIHPDRIKQCIDVRFEVEETPMLQQSCVESC